MRSKLHQDVTYWASTGENKYGEEGYAAPVVISARWEERIEQVRKDNGDIITSKAVVFVDRDMGIGDRLATGDWSATSDPEMAGALEVQSFHKIPSMRTNEAERRAVL